MFTRHFYEYDEVVGALQICIIRRRIKEAAFWCEELLVTYGRAKTLSILVETWLLYINFMLSDWIVNAMDGGADIHELCCALAESVGRDNSVWAVAALQGEPVERLNSGSGSGSSSSAAAYFAGAIQQRKARAAWWGAHQLPDGRAWDILCSSSSSVYKWLHDLDASSMWLCGSIVFACGSRLINKTAANMVCDGLSDGLRADIARWRESVGKRVRREYAIPIEHIYGIGPRWILGRDSNNLDRLYRCEEVIRSEKDGFWRGVMKRYNLDTDDSREMFFWAYFPDDIPDEWSLADQSKSHGKGMLSAAEVESGLNIGKWTRAWLGGGNLARLTWGFEDIKYGVINKMWICDNLEKQFEPVVRRYEVV